MTTTTKLALSVLAGALAMGSAVAAPITGTVSFTGEVVAYVSSSASGATDYNFSNDHSLKFGATQVSALPAPTGSFAGTGGNTVTMYSPLLINQPGVTPPPALTPLWSFSTFQFFVSGISASYGTPDGTTDSMMLLGTGTVHDTSNTYADNTGTWRATFTSSVDGTNVSFSFNSSAAASNNVPETGTSVLLLGLGLAAIGAYGQFRKQVA